MADKMLRAVFVGGSLDGTEDWVPASEDRRFVAQTGEVYESDGFEFARGSGDEIDMVQKFIVQAPDSDER